jgi:hypothetical protein
LTRDLQLQQHRVQCLGHALAIVLRHLSTLPQQQPTKDHNNKNQKQQSEDDRAANARRTPTLRIPKEESEEDRVKITERSFFTITFYLSSLVFFPHNINSH